MPVRARTIRVAAVALALLHVLARSAAGQAPLHIWPYSLRLADVSVTSSTTTGVTLYFAPAVTTIQGRDSTRLVSLSFHPDSALAWVDRVARLNHSGDRADLPDGVTYTRPLATPQQDGSIALGVDFQHGHPKRERVLGLVDGAQAWRVLLTATEVDSLTSLIFAAATESELPPLKAAGHRSEQETASDYQSIAVVHETLSPSKGQVGRVLATYEVGTDGRVDPTSVVVLLATSPQLVDLVRTTLRDAVFKPALRSGQPVRATVQQTFVFKSER